jgi:hypothetical protein
MERQVQLVLMNGSQPAINVQNRVAFGYSQLPPLVISQRSKHKYEVTKHVNVRKPFRI